MSAVYCYRVWTVDEGKGTKVVTDRFCSHHGDLAGKPYADEVPAVLGSNQHLELITDRNDLDESPCLVPDCGRTLSSFGCRGDRCEACGERALPLGTYSAVP